MTRLTQTTAYTCIAAINEKLATLISGKKVLHWVLNDLFFVFEKLNAIEKLDTQDILVVFRLDKEAGVGGIEIILREKQLSQFSCTHVGYFEILAQNYRCLCFQFSPFNNLSEVVAPFEFLLNWDNQAEKITDPDNGGKYLEIGGYISDKEAFELHVKTMKAARENGSISSLVRCFKNLTRKEKNMPSNVRVTVSANRNLDEYYFVMRFIGRDGQWHTRMNGGIIYHRTSNEWSTHT